MDKRAWIISATALGGIALLTAAATPRSPADTATVISVSGTGTVNATNNVATMTASVRATRSTMAAATEESAAKMRRIFDALQGLGIARRDMQTIGLSLETVRRTDDGGAHVIEFQADNAIQIRFRDIGLSGKVFDVLGHEDVERVVGPQISLEAGDAAYNMARTTAVKQARARADLLAQAAGMHVKRLRSLQGGYETSYSRAMPAAMVQRVDASTPLAEGQAALSATVSAEYELE